MVVEIISVGTELLLGNTVNTNAAYLAEQCAKLGLSCYYQTTVGDNEKRLDETFRLALSRADVVILSGGLGPTQDDITKETVARVLGKELYVDEQIKEQITDYFTKSNMLIMDNNWKQAMVPNGAKVIHNMNGTAPGLIMDENGKTVILLPGPSVELIPMFEQYIAMHLNKKTPEIIYSQIVKICGISESKVESMIEDLVKKQTNPTIAPYAKTGEVHLRVTAKAENEIEAQKLCKPIIKELKSRFRAKIYSTEEDMTLEKSVVDLLIANNLTIATIESCTGGLLAGRLINVPGVSEVFKSGFVTYSNKAKRKIVGVKKNSLHKYGAVSEKVASEMAKGTSQLSKADVTVSVTGIAGPDGGTADKPVGLVYIGCCVKGKVVVQKYHFSGSREKIRNSSVAAALTLLRKCVLEYYSEVTFGNKSE